MRNKARWGRGRGRGGGAGAVHTYISMCRHLQRPNSHMGVFFFCLNYSTFRVPEEDVGNLTRRNVRANQCIIRVMVKP